MTARQSLRRRRRVTAVLAGATLLTVVVALSAARPGMWAVAVLSGVVFAAYVALLVHARNVSAAIEMSAPSLDG